MSQSDDDFSLQKGAEINVEDAREVKCLHELWERNNVGVFAWKKGATEHIYRKLVNSMPILFEIN